MAVSYITLPLCYMNYAKSTYILVPSPLTTLISLPFMSTVHEKENKKSYIKVNMLNTSVSG